MPARLPQFLRPWFWDYPFSRLTWREDRDLIIARVLAHGALRGIRWLRTRLGDEALRRWLEHRQGAGLSPQQLRYWELILGIPHKEVSCWLRAPGRRIWDQRRSK